MNALMRRGLAGVAAIVVVATGVGVARAQDGGQTSYRTATATVGDVRQTVSLTGTVAHPSTADTVFQTSGTVDQAYVAVGDQVAAGQKLASLDTGVLDQAVTQAESDLASAKARLASDQTALAEAADEEAAQEKASKAADAQQKAAQQALRQAEQAASQTLRAAEQALATAQQTCAGSDAAACAAALRQTEDAQAQVGRGQAAYAKALAGQSSEGGPQGGSQDSSQSAQGASDGSSQVSPGGQGGSVSAATIASDKASVVSAEAALLEAQQARARAVVRSPVSGVVAEVSVATDDSVTAGTPAVTVIGDGVTTVELAVTAAKAHTIKSGQKATVTVPGRDDPLTGTVTNVGLLPDTSTGDTTYPVTVTLDGGSDLATGVTASVAIETGSATQVVTVPVSAISDGSVRVLDGDTVRTQAVTVGVVGATSVQVDGIAEGTEVVLADVGADLPSNSQQGRGGLGGLNGGPTVTFSGGGPGGNFQRFNR